MKRNVTSTPQQRMKTWKGWAQVFPEGQIITIAGGPMVYATKKDALLDLDCEGYVCRVEIREVKK